MKIKKHLKYILILGALLLLCVGGILMMEFSAPKPIAEIYLDGALYQRIQLDSLKEPIEIKVGEGNVFLADREGIRMIHADCPDHLCIKQGKLRSGNRSITCLPNRVSASLRAKSEMDGVSG